MTYIPEITAVILALAAGWALTELKGCLLRLSAKL